MIKPDTLIGHYRVIRQVGSGGMADVYEAEDQKLGRHVALKILPPELGRNPQFTMRFEREVRAAAGLNHHGIVTVFEVGEHEGLHYYSMRLLTGGDLRSRIHGPMPEVESLALIREVSDAFAHAHTRGFVHRDVKPENIIFDEQGFPILTDFGIAKALHGDTSVTATGVSIGTPRYISPEQARGHKVDGRSDIYSLGVILYELLTGHPPYDAEESLAVIFKHVTEPIPKLPDELLHLQALIDTLMAKEPDQRPDNAEMVIALIDRFLSTKQTSEFRSIGTGQVNPVVQKLLTPAPPPAALNTAETRHAESLATEHQRQVEDLDRRYSEGDVTLEAPAVPDSVKTAMPTARPQITPRAEPAAASPPPHTPAAPPPASPAEASKKAPPPAAKAEAAKPPPQATLPPPVAHKSRKPWIIFSALMGLVAVGAIGLSLFGDGMKSAMLEYAVDMAEKQSAEGDSNSSAESSPPSEPVATETAEVPAPEAAAATELAKQQAAEDARRQAAAAEARKKADEAQRKQASLEAQRLADERAEAKRQAELKQRERAAAEQRRAKAEAEAKKRADAQAKREASERQQTAAAEQRKAENAALMRDPDVRKAVARDSQFIQRHQQMLDRDLDGLASTIFIAQRNDPSMAAAIRRVLVDSEPAKLEQLYKAINNEQLKADEAERQRVNQQRIAAEERARREAAQERLRTENTRRANAPRRIDLSADPLVQKYETAEPGFIKKYKDMYRNNRSEYDQIMVFVSQLNPERAEAVQRIGKAAEVDAQIDGQP